MEVPTTLHSLGPAQKGKEVQTPNFCFIKKTSSMWSFHIYEESIATQDNVEEFHHAYFGIGECRVPSFTNPGFVVSLNIAHPKVKYV
jgi:hypothetical protein